MQRFVLSVRMVGSTTTKAGSRLSPRWGKNLNSKWSVGVKWSQCVWVTAGVVLSSSVQPGVLRRLAGGHVPVHCQRGLPGQQLRFRLLRRQVRVWTTVDPLFIITGSFLRGCSHDYTEPVLTLRWLVTETLSALLRKEPLLQSGIGTVTPHRDKSHNSALLSVFRFGRRLSFLLSNILNFITGIILAVAPNYISILVFRSIFGFAVKGGWMTSYVLRKHIYSYIVYKSTETFQYFIMCSFTTLKVVPSLLAARWIKVWDIFSLYTSSSQNNSKEKFLRVCIFPSCKIHFKQLHRRDKDGPGANQWWASDHFSQ